jgi:hypothetical protein
MSASVREEETCALDAAAVPAEESKEALEIPLTFKKMFGIHWDIAVGKLLFGRGVDAEPVLHGKVKRTQYTNFGGPFRTIVTFEDGAKKEFPLGPESPPLAVRDP